ncbi:MAG TPA: hypothetical protein PK411_04140 [Mesotoga infera]|jgi:hypothetical protein|uniref:Roadblock/LC7 domain-containing protein n=1 Tax=Mesotoga infera TaxID=1236046 RepID=A0A7Z7PPX4_9BACT|nr:hypothetical protein [Mesotoga infera]MBP8660834.1 hypothetical protein [Mesotoga sp.]NLI07250.1 hypothetical protein [Thermotogaceae bacterium]SSC13553.1 conserved protein of unknown function [Mesotoga infera]HNR79203.1 hypothetical protein [Mesotoga infera]HNS66122.1 hypothetical protein [Mesotoga infera]
MENLARKIRELGETCGMVFRVVDKNGKSFEEGYDLEEIPPLVIALSKATGSRSSTLRGGVPLTAVYLDGMRNECYLIVVGEFREDNAFRLLKHIAESFEVRL